MSANTNIEWTDRTWSVTRGCSVVSPGCHQCYAMKMAHRFSKPGMPFAKLTKATSSGPQWTGAVRSLPNALLEPLSWKKPQRVFVNSMSDLFHEDVPDAFIDQVFAVMALAPRHTFQILTKRPERMRAYLAAPMMASVRIADAAKRLHTEVRPFALPSEEVFDARRVVLGQQWIIPTDRSWPLRNVWLGVSVEDQQRADERIPLLLQTPAAVRFISAEPILSAVHLGRYIGDERRAGIPSTGRIGLVRSPGGWNDLASGGVQRRGSGDVEILPSDEGGAECVSRGRLPESDVSGWAGAETSRCSSDRLDGGKQGRHSGVDGNQPSQWGQGAQPSDQPGAGDPFGEREARNSRSGAPAEGPRRDRQLGGQGERATGDGNKGAVGCQGAVAAPDSRALRSEAEHGALHRLSKDLEAPRLNWVIVGGESGPGARPCDVAWVRSIVQQCQAAGVPVFVKQMGAHVIDRNDAGFLGEEPDHWPDVIDQEDRIEHDLDGTRDGYQGAPVRIHLKDRKGGDQAEWPEDLQVREFPR